MYFRGVTGLEIILLRLPGRSASRVEGGGGGVGRGSYIQDLKVSTEGAVTGSGGRLFHSLMVRGKKDSFL